MSEEERRDEVLTELGRHLNMLHAHLSVVVMHSEMPDLIGAPDIEQIKIDMEKSNDAVNRLIRKPLGFLGEDEEVLGIK